MKKKKRIEIIKNGNPFKLIVYFDVAGNISGLMEKPNLKSIKDTQMNLSGAHILSSCFEQNHIDWFLPGGSDYKERPENGEIRMYGYEISGSSITRFPSGTKIIQS